MKKNILMTFMLYIVDTSTALAKEEATMPVKTASLDNLAEKIANLSMSFYDAVGTFVMPLSISMLTLMAAILIIGLFIGVRKIKTICVIGLALCLLGLFLYAAAPIIAYSIYEAGSNLIN